MPIVGVTPDSQPPKELVVLIADGKATYEVYRARRVTRFRSMMRDKDLARKRRKTDDRRVSARPEGGRRATHEVISRYSTG